MTSSTKNPHFFSLHSRLGLQNPPLGSRSIIRGVEYGASSILSPSFLRSFSDVLHDLFVFPLPEQVDPPLYIDSIIDSSRKCAGVISKRWDSKRTQVCVGGDHSITFSTLLALQERVDFDRMGFIQIDSHADTNLRATSPTGNFHGMYMRPFLDAMDIAEINNLVLQRIRHNQLWYWGNMDLDKEEGEFIKKHRITITNRNGLLAVDVMKKRLHEFMKRVSHIHVNIDIDAFDRSIAPATGIPAVRGLLLQDVLLYLRMLSAFPSISIDLVEVNPTLAGAVKTVRLAQSILTVLLGG